MAGPSRASLLHRTAPGPPSHAQRCSLPLPSRPRALSRRDTCPEPSPRAPKLGSVLRSLLRLFGEDRAKVLNPQLPENDSFPEGRHVVSSL